jgi:hypothetical protein
VSHSSKHPFVVVRNISTKVIEDSFIGKPLVSRNHTFHKGDLII